jgi:hypothetical protein
MFRIAICISGQSRTYKHCLLNQKRLFETMMISDKDIQIDYFFHTWDTNHWTTIGSDKRNIHLLPQLPANIDVDFIKSNINLIDYKIEKFNDSKINKLWGPALYSIHWCNYLKRKEEIKKGFRYDLVIKTRFDLLFPPDIRYSVFTPLEDHVMYTGSPMSRMDSELNYYNFDDVFFYGTSFTMDIIADTYRYIDSNFNHHKFGADILNMDIPFEYYYGPGCLLYRHGTLWGLSASHTNPLPYIIGRFAAIEQNLNGITDYDKLLKINLDYYNDIPVKRTKLL